MATRAAIRFSRLRSDYRLEHHLAASSGGFRAAGRSCTWCCPIAGPGLAGLVSRNEDLGDRVRIEWIGYGQASGSGNPYINETVRTRHARGRRALQGFAHEEVPDGHRRAGAFLALAQRAVVV